MYGTNFRAIHGVPKHIGGIPAFIPYIFPFGRIFTPAHHFVSHIAPA